MQCVLLQEMQSILPSVRCNTANFCLLLQAHISTFYALSALDPNQQKENISLVRESLIGKAHHYIRMAPHLLLVKYCHDSH